MGAAARRLALSLDAAAEGRLKRAAALRTATEGKAERSRDATSASAPGAGLVLEVSRRSLRLSSGGTAESVLEIGALTGPDGVAQPWRRWLLTVAPADAAGAAELVRACRLGEGVRWIPAETEAWAARLLALSPTAQRGAPAALSAALPVGAALAQILDACLTHWTGNLEGVIAGVPEAVHQARVGLRRQRAAISLFKSTGLTPPPGLADGLRRLAGAFGDARDWDVFLGEILPPPRRAGGAGADFAGVTAAATAKRDAGRQGAAQAAGGAEALEAALASWAWIGALQAVAEGDPIAKVAAGLLDKRLRQARRRGRVYESLTDDARHSFRIYIKKLRYGVDFFQSILPPKRRRKAQAALEEILDGLGALNDVATARRLLGDLMAAPEADVSLAYAAGVIAGWHDDAAERRAAQVGRLWRAFDQTKPCWLK